MRERPILFNGEMVRAILDGRKTQTRRPVTERWLPLVEEVVRVNGKWVFSTVGYDLTTPFGEPGDRLWVRETWAIDRCGSRVSLSSEAWPDGWPTLRLKYIATDEAPWPPREWAGDQSPPYWWNKRPSIHMPRWASRITLEITGVRVERLKNISEEDARAEGIEPVEVDGTDQTGSCVRPCHALGFSFLWDAINGEGAWDANPWVWVIEFKKVQ